MSKKILVGVCGGIASYKTCQLIRLLRKDGFAVKVVMTRAAAKFVTPLVFQTLSGNLVYLNIFKEGQDIEHVSLAQWADLGVIAPLSANTLSKIANGICDNLLTTLICAFPQNTKVVLTPAMNENMWKNPIVQENVKKLRKIKKYILIEPKKGKLASGIYGEGRMPEPRDIFSLIKKTASKRYR